MQFFLRRRYWPLIAIAAVFAVTVFLEWQVKTTPQPPLSAAAPQIPALAASQPSAPSSLEKSGPKQTPTTASQNASSNQGRSTEDQSPVVKTASTPETQSKAANNAANQEQKTADKHVLEIGIGAIVVGALQTAALFFTFWVMRKTAIRQLRAYVFVETCQFTRNPHSDTDPWEILLILKNFGQTPAANIRLKTERDIRLSIVPEMVLEFSKSAQTSNTLAIAPGHISTTRMPILSANSDLGAKRQAGEKIYVWAEIEYQDVFKIRRILKVQMVHDFGNVLELSFCEAGNGTDD